MRSEKRKRGTLYSCSFLYLPLSAFGYFLALMAWYLKRLSCYRTIPVIMSATMTKEIATFCTEHLCQFRGFHYIKELL